MIDPPWKRGGTLWRGNYFFATSILVYLSFSSALFETPPQISPAFNRGDGMMNRETRAGECLTRWIGRVGPFTNPRCRLSLQSLAPGSWVKWNLIVKFLGEEMKNVVVEMFDDYFLVSETETRLSFKLIYRRPERVICDWNKITNYIWEKIHDLITTYRKKIV